MDKYKWFIFAGACVAIIAGVVFFNKSSSVDVSNVDPVKIEASGEFADHVFGNKDAKVVLVEYGDFQCPGCGSAYPIVKTVTEKYKNDVAFVFRNLPLTNLHPNALAAAAAAEAAGKQNKYWEMHDRLYTSQASWENASADDRTTIFEGYAKDLGLNVDQYRSDQASDVVAAKINRDRALAQKIGANSTPSFYINGNKVADNSWQAVATFDKTITDALKAVGVTPKPVDATQSSGGNY